MEYLEIINSIILVGLTVAFFLQNNKLKILKTIIDSYQPEKLKQAQEYIEQGNEYKMKLELRQHIDQISKKSSQRFMEVNKTFHECYDELILMPFSICKDKNWEEREQFLKTLPRNAEYLRMILEAHDNGKLDEFVRKHK
jgi:hypothetical protein